MYLIEYRNVATVDGLDYKIWTPQQTNAADTPTAVF
jgi:hypothetical protein